MTDRAMEFSRRGDRVFGALAERFTSGERKRLAIAQKLRAEQYAAVRSAMLTYISACLGQRSAMPEPEVLDGLLAQRDTLKNYRPDGLLVPKREQVLEFNLLHRAVAAAFRGFGIERHADVIDLPINVRVVYGKPATGRTSLPYASSKVHADVWAGVPVDAVVVVMPVLGDIDNITIECGEMAAEQELEAMRVLPDYLEGRMYKMIKPYDDVHMQHGSVYLCDARLLHQTVRRKRENVRVSIDFRFRMSDMEYRSMAPDVRGPEAMDTTVAYERWLGVGSQSMIVFDKSIETASENVDPVVGAPYGLEYRLVDLFPG
jgi:hypothetical protein